MSLGDRESFPQHILDHYEDPYHRGPLDRATHVFEAENPICGDRIRMQLRADSEGVVDEAWFDGDGCVASQAAASLLVERAEGQSLEQLSEFSADDMMRLIGHDLPPNRQKCFLLGWRVLQRALEAPVDDGSDDRDCHFGGPSLGEES